MTEDKVETAMIERAKKLGANSEPEVSGLRCVLSSPERVAAGLCLGDIPAERIAKKAVTCSDECQRHYRNFRRRLLAEGKCRLCGRGRPAASKRRTTEPVLHAHKASCGAPASGVSV